MKEIIFTVESDPDGGLVACAEGECIVTQAENFELLAAEIRDAVCCHLDEGLSCPPIRVKFNGEEFML